MGPIDVACQDLQYAIKNVTRVNFLRNYDELAPVLVARIDNPTAKNLKMYVHVQVVNSINFMSAEDGAST